jgi:hypothetical protein
MSVHEIMAILIYGFAAAKDCVAAIFIGFSIILFIVYLRFLGDNQPKIARMSTFVCLKYRLLFFLLFSATFIIECSGYFCCDSNYSL